MADPGIYGGLAARYGRRSGIEGEGGGGGRHQANDSRGGRARKQQQDPDENKRKPHLEPNNALGSGVPHTAGEPYGVTMRRRTDPPARHPNAMTFGMFGCPADPLAIPPLGPYPRARGRGGARMTFPVHQSPPLCQKPVAHDALNIWKPAEGTPDFLGRNDGTTLFHEFGHGLHGIPSNPKHSTLPGTNPARDLPEFPSQNNEHWGAHDAVLGNCALRYEKKGPIPRAPVDRTKAAGARRARFHTTEVARAAQLDL
ncbi:uncharacterized protein [Leishmania mexicana MHOM/GT/2001/U1103]|uniref:Peptidase M3A/M3B catalytic domain-containing protein n=1 Tax=Leishmania mexicana (strain MHOM/GT/2001/U1103) TaxID=929439 RepID=E9AJG9_LEIMU|nr:uncharacterized protein [Leishmania mexicana MHOM/GT/2001/U1103]CBZ23066.1 unnamed protein product [Leishmania mexicana MHOM/GT/2001/U1103]